MTRRPELLFLIVLGAFVLHAALADNLVIFGARPNLCVVALLICALYTGPELGAALGLFAGVLEGSYTPLYLGSFLATRLAAGAAVGALEHRVYRDNAPFALATVLVGSPLLESLFYLFAPQPDSASYFLSALKQTGYHAALALPIYWLIARVMHGRDGGAMAAKRP